MLRLKLILLIIITQIDCGDLLVLRPIPLQFGLCRNFQELPNAAASPTSRLYPTKVKLQNNQSHPFLSCFLDYGLAFQEFVSTHFMSLVFLFFCVFGLSTLCGWVLQMTSSLVTQWISFLQI
jgi:hypothetical protein